MPTDLVLLGLLHIDDFYGYEIMKIIKTVMLQITDITTGTLYYKLKGLEKKGLVSHFKEQDGRRPVRYRYSITPRGREEFRRAAQENLDSAGRPYWPIMPSLFFIKLLDPDMSRIAINKHIERLEAQILKLEKISGILRENRAPLQGRLIVEHGVEHIKVDIDILKRFSDSLEDRDTAEFDFASLKERLRRYMVTMPDLGRSS